MRPPKKSLSRKRLQLRSPSWSIISLTLCETKSTKKVMKKQKRKTKANQNKNRSRLNPGSTSERFEASLRKLKSLNRARRLRKKMRATMRNPKLIPNLNSGKNEPSRTISTRPQVSRTERWRNWQLKETLSVSLSKASKRKLPRRKCLRSVNGIPIPCWSARTRRLKGLAPMTQS